MIFDELYKKMRIYERSLDQVLLPETYMVARPDGRGFTRLTKEICKFEAPFDERFRDIMVNTVEALMDCGHHGRSVGLAYGLRISKKRDLIR